MATGHALVNAMVVTVGTALARKLAESTPMAPAAEPCDRAFGAPLMDCA